MNLASFKDINIKRLLAHEEKAIVSSSMPSALIGASVLVENNHLYYGNIDSGEGLFFVYDSIPECSQLDFFPLLSIASEGDFTVMNSNRIAVNTRLNRVVSGMRFYNKLYLYDVEKKGDVERGDDRQESYLPYIGRAVHKRRKPTLLYGNTRYGSICLRVDAARQGKRLG